MFGATQVMDESGATTDGSMDESGATTHDPHPQPLPQPLPTRRRESTEFAALYSIEFWKMDLGAFTGRGQGGPCLTDAAQ